MYILLDLKTAPVKLNMSTPTVLLHCYCGIIRALNEKTQPDIQKIKKRLIWNARSKKITVPILKWNVTASYSDRWDKSSRVIFWAACHYQWYWLIIDITCSVDLYVYRHPVNCSDPCFRGCIVIYICSFIYFCQVQLMFCCYSATFTVQKWLCFYSLFFFFF